MRIAALILALALATPAGAATFVVRDIVDLHVVLGTPVAGDTVVVTKDAAWWLDGGPHKFPAGVTVLIADYPAVGTTPDPRDVANEALILSGVGQVADLKAAIADAAAKLAQVHALGLAARKAAVKNAVIDQIIAVTK